MRASRRGRLPTIIWAKCVVAHLLTFAIVNYVQPAPYMDEIFHVPQAQRFCRMDLAWDSMITTLPGVMAALIAYDEQYQ